MNNHNQLLTQHAECAADHGEEISRTQTDVSGETCKGTSEIARVSDANTQTHCRSCACVQKAQPAAKTCDITRQNDGIVQLQGRLPRGEKGIVLLARCQIQ